MNDQYLENLLRFIAASQWASVQMKVAHSLFGKDLHKLFEIEKNIACAQAATYIAELYKGLDANSLKGILVPATGPVGFQPQPSGVPGQQPSQPAQK